MKLTRIFSTALCLLLGATATFAQSRITQEHKSRAADIVSQMTLDEKICDWHEYLLSSQDIEKY